MLLTLIRNQIQKWTRMLCHFQGKTMKDEALVRPPDRVSASPGQALRTKETCWPMDVTNSLLQCPE